MKKMDAKNGPTNDQIRTNVPISVFEILERAGGEPKCRRFLRSEKVDLKSK